MRTPLHLQALHLQAVHLQAVHVQAVDPRTPASRLGQLARDSPALALAVAQNPAATPRLLARLARSPDRAVQEAVCVHPRTPPATVYRLAVAMPAVFAGTELGRTLYRAGPGGAPRTWVVRRLLASHPVPPAWIEALVGHPHPAARVVLARQAELPGAALLRLAADPSPRVRCAIADHVLLAPTQVEALARDPDADVRERIARRDDLDAGLVALLAADADAFVRLGVARRPNLDPARAELLFCDPSTMVRWALARNPACPEPLLLAFAAEDDPWLDDELLANASTPPAALLQVGPRIAGRLRPAPNQMLLVQHPRSTEEVVTAILRSAPPELRGRLIFYARELCTALIFELAGDPHPSVGSALSTRPELGVEVLWRLFAHADGLPRGGAAKHALAPAALIQRAAVDQDPWVRRSVAQNPSTPAHLLEMLARDGDRMVRAEVARHTRDVSLLKRLANDPSEQVIYQVLYNEHTPKELAARLREHPGVRAMSSRY